MAVSIGGGLRLDQGYTYIIPLQGTRSGHMICPLYRLSTSKM